MAWVRPSDRVSELFREGVRRALSGDEVAATVAAIEADTASDPVLAADPALLAAVQRSNRSNVAHWVQAVLADPGAPVAPNTSPDAVASIRELVRRGHDGAILDVWTGGQAVAVRTFMRVAVTVTTDADELAELLDHGTRSILDFSRATAAATSAMVQAEREQLTRGTHALRLETVTLILDGAPISRERAATRLGYDLDRPHLAAIAWIDESEPDTAALDATAEALATAVGATRPLSVLATAASRWIWLSTARAPDPPAVAAILADHPTVQLALGSLANGVTGFRRSHHDALATQRLLMRSPGGVRTAAWDDVRVAALISGDDVRAREFVRQALGDLADADPDLRETVRVYLREQSSAPRTARLLHTHRNTILTRVARAERLLPRPLADTALDVAVALEVSRWTTAGTAADARQAAEGKSRSNG